MPFIEMLLLAFGVSLDAFSVSVSGAMTSPEKPWRKSLLAMLFFGGFQFLMPLAGGLAGNKFGPFITGFDHYIAFVLLFFVGAKMIFESFKPEKELCKNGEKCDIFKLKSMFILAIATSIDAAAVGASIPLSGHTMSDLFYCSTAMGIVTGIFGFSGVWIGRKVGDICGKKAEIAGGLVLIGIGLKILISHLAA